MSRRKYIDELDIKLLNVLKRYPNDTVIELSEKIDLSPGPTNTRVLRLKDEGFIKKDFSIDYTKFGITKRIFSFLLQNSSNNSNQIDTEKGLREINNKLKKVKNVLIESIALLENSKNEYWIWISFYPVNEKELNPSKNGNLNIEYDNTNLSTSLKEYIQGESQLYKLLENNQILPELSKNHVIRKKLLP